MSLCARHSVETIAQMEDDCQVCLLRAILDVASDIADSLDDFKERVLQVMAQDQKSLDDALNLLQNAIQTLISKIPPSAGLSAEIAEVNNMIAVVQQATPASSGGTGTGTGTGSGGGTTTPPGGTTTPPATGGGTPLSSSP